MRAQPEHGPEPGQTGTGSTFPGRLVDVAPVMLWLAGPDQLRRHFNRRWLEFTGRTLAQELGRGWLEGVHPEDRDACQRALQAAFAARQEFRTEYRLRRHDGVYRWLVEQGIPLWEGRAEFSGYAGTCLDATDRIEAEREAHAQRERLLVTLASIGDGVIVTDARARTTFLNPVAEALTGWGRDEAQGQSLDLIFNVVHQRTRSKLSNPAHEAIRTGKVIGLANHALIISRDGCERAISDSAAPIRSREGKVDGCVLVFRDVTEQKKAEEARLYLSAIVESSDDAIVSKNLNGIITSWNQGAERIFGYSAAEAVGRPVTMLIPREQLSEEDDILARLRRGERIDHFETVRLTKDGRRLSISLTVSPIRNREGEIIGASKIARDITSRKQAEEAVLESQDRFRTLADNIAQLAWMADASGSVFWYNQRWFDYTGTTLEEMRGWQWQQVHHPEYVQAVAEKYRRHVESGQSWEDTFPLRGKDGQYRWFLSRAVPIRDGSGRIVRWFGTNTDITDWKETQEALRRAQAQLISSNEELERRVRERTARLRSALSELEAFSYSISHDLRAPLRAMQQYSQVLLEDYGDKLDPDATRFLNYIVAAGARADALIRDVLTYSRIVRLPYEPRPVDLEKLLADVIRQDPALQPPRAEIHVEHPLTPVLGNETFLTQCLANLLVNAVKFVRSGVTAKVRIWTEERPPNIRLWLSDNGIGIAPEHHQRIFGMFERVHAPKEYEGTGIGLAIVKKAAERMGGRVGLESELGRGSRFWLELRPADPTSESLRTDHASERLADRHSHA